EGGYASVLHFTVDNSPIFSDEILSIAVDGNTGRVYFSTDRGLVSFISDAVNPSASTDDLIVFPNPLRLSDGETPQVFIDGLVSSTTIRIVSPNGSLVRRLQGRGGMMRWDGKDENGRLVSSGVYLIIAVGDNDEGTAYGKVAVIR
ncbi:MAG: regulator, partial [Bacteroidetes Order II. Incertae sedis bacterium]|nr:regulator [Bacteroidetes Order II. bacterium]